MRTTDLNYLILPQVSAESAKVVTFGTVNMVGWTGGERDPWLSLLLLGERDPWLCHCYCKVYQRTKRTVGRRMESGMTYKSTIRSYQCRRFCKEFYSEGWWFEISTTMLPYKWYLWETFPYLCTNKTLLLTLPKLFKYGFCNPRNRNFPRNRS